MPGFVETLGMKPVDVSLVGKCLRAAIDGPYFPDWEFRTLIGVSRDELRQIADAWPQIDVSDDNFSMINNSLLNLIGYPHSEDDALTRATGVDRTQIGRCLERYRQAWGDRVG